jgi:hypothetical protein
MLLLKPWNMGYNLDILGKSWKLKHWISIFCMAFLQTKNPDAASENEGSEARWIQPTERLVRFHSRISPWDQEISPGKLHFKWQKWPFYHWFAILPIKKAEWSLEMMLILRASREISFPGVWNLPEWGKTPLGVSDYGDWIGTIGYLCSMIPGIFRKKHMDSRECNATVMVMVMVMRCLN